MEPLKNLLQKQERIKPPAHQWQDLALRVIAELGIPAFKRNSVFKICKDHSREIVERAMNDTKELVKTGESWRYFFKVIASFDAKRKTDPGPVEKTDSTNENNPTRS